jgi:hypothetical protein
MIVMTITMDLDYLVSKNYDPTVQSPSVVGLDTWGLQ